MMFYLIRYPGRLDDSTAAHYGPHWLPGLWIRILGSSTVLGEFLGFSHIFLDFVFDNRDLRPVNDLNAVAFHNDRLGSGFLQLILLNAIHLEYRDAKACGATVKSLILSCPPSA